MWILHTDFIQKAKQKNKKKSQKNCLVTEIFSTVEIILTFKRWKKINRIEIRMMKSMRFVFVCIELYV